MIKALILDIDGIVTGGEKGVNFPLPSVEVQKYLQNLGKQKIPVSLCSTKAAFAIKPVVLSCNLETFHITDAGATLVNFMTNEYSNFTIASQTVKRLTEDLIKAQIYTEWYDTNDLYYSLPQGNSIIRNNRVILFSGKEAIPSETPPSENIKKIIILPETPFQHDQAVKIAEQYKDIELHWGINPSKIPTEAGFFTLKTATKRTGAERLSKLTGIPLSETLAMGDSTNDWTFMELCGYVATLGNGTAELKELIKTRGDHGFTSLKTVDEDGLTDVLKHFSI